MPNLKETEPCPFCGKPVERTAERCDHCDEDLYEDVDDSDLRPRGGGDASAEQGLQWLLPIGRSAWSIAAGYLGLLSCFPILGAACGILAVIFGILGLASAKKNPRLGGKGRAIFGIIAGSISIVLHVVVLAAFLLSKM
jgi:hypothetical protein